MGELQGGAPNKSAVGAANFFGVERERGCLDARRAEQVAGSLAQLLTNQVLIEMAIQELVTVPVVNVNLTQPIRRTTKRSSRGSRSRTRQAPPGHPKTVEGCVSDRLGGGWGDR